MVRRRRRPLGPPPGPAWPMMATVAGDEWPARNCIVDDDEAVREAVCEALATLGYLVEPARDAGDALGRFHPGRYQLVVTDLAMPVMNGLELARQLRALEPG